MTIRETDQYLVAPSRIRITRDGFKKMVDDLVAPAVKNEPRIQGDTGRYFDLILDRPHPDGRVVSPELLPAKLRKESSGGREGVAVTSKSWGNTREPNFGPVVPIGMHPRGFPIWRDWLDGLDSTVSRLVAENWYYAGERRNIRGLYIDPLQDDPDYPHAMPPVPRTVRSDGVVLWIAWAPQHDRNEPEGYLRFVLDLMNQYADIEGGPPVATPYDHIIKGLVDFRSQLERNPNGGPNRTVSLESKRKFKGVVIHFNGPEVGANDRQHIINVSNYHAFVKDWDENSAPPKLFGDGIMYHVAVTDQGEKLLLRDLEAMLWHCGDTEWNRNSIAIFLPIGGLQRVTEIQKQATFEVLRDYEAWVNHGLDVRGHQEISPTDCPGTAMADVVRAWRDGVTPPVDSATIEVPGVGTFTVQGPWYDAWVEAGGSSPDGPGLPFSNTYAMPAGGGVTITAQDFERDRIELWPDGRITWGRTNAELLEVRRRIAELEEGSNPEIAKRFHGMSWHTRRAHEWLTKPVDELPSQPGD